MTRIVEQVGDVIVVSENGRLELHIPSGWMDYKLRKYKLIYQTVLDRLKIKTKVDEKEQLKHIQAGSVSE